MVQQMELEQRWITEAAFVRDAVIEKIERWKAEGHRLPAGPGPEELGRGPKSKTAR